MTNIHEGHSAGDQNEQLASESIQPQEEATSGPESILSTEEQALVLNLRELGLENNQAFLEFVASNESALDLIQEPHEGALARVRFDIRKAVIIGSAGDLDYAYELLASIGKMAQETGNDTIEDEVDDALTSLGL